MCSSDLPSVAKIGRFAFEFCESLTGAFFPDGAVELWADSFGGCSKLTVYAPAGSLIEQVADKFDLPFVPLEAFLEAPGM